MIVCCGILQKEIEHLMQGREEEILYLDAGQHVDPEALARSVTGALKALLESSGFIFFCTSCKTVYSSKSNSAVR